MAAVTVDTSQTELTIDVSAVQTKIKNITSMSIQGQSAEKKNITTFDDDQRVYKRGNREPKVITINFFYDPGDAVHEELETLDESGAVVDCELKFPDAGETLFTFSAYVDNFDYDGQAEDEWRGTVTLQLQSAITKGTYGT